MSHSTSLFPREHGAYAELGFPVLTGLLAAGPSLAGFAFAVAAVSAFLAHEPVAILTGRRGKRLAYALSGRARTRAAWLVGITAVAGGVAMLVGSGPARLAAVVPLVGALAVAAAAALGRTKTLWAEVLVIATLAAVLVPIAVAGGAPWRFAWSASVVWFVVFVLGTVAVHGIKAAHKGRLGRSWTPTLAPALVVLSVGGALLGSTNGVLETRYVAALLPPAAVAFVASLVRVHPRRLRTVGWSLVAANLITLVVLLVA